jgi:hypothetical protein
MQKLEHNEKNFNRCIRQLNTLKEVGLRITSNSQNADYSEFLSVKEMTTNHLLSYFINGNEIRERIKEIESAKLDTDKGWLKMIAFVALYYLFPPTALYFAIRGYKKEGDVVQRVQTIIGQVDSLLFVFVLKDKRVEYS